MSTFSHRIGLHSQRAILGPEEMDMPLRTRLRNVILGTLLTGPVMGIASFNSLFKNIWGDLLEQRLDLMPNHVDDRTKQLGHILQNAPWNEVYDLIEYVLVNFRVTDPRDHMVVGHTVAMLELECNDALEKGGAAWRVKDKHFFPISNETELESIDQALRPDGAWDRVAEHLSTALQHLSDRDEPDYNNSVKEAITAVEAACQIVTGNPKAILSDALKIIGDEKLHPALKDALTKLYGWTSDDGGLRHAGITRSEVDFDLAKWMIVTCSAFINFLRAKDSS